LEAPVLNHITVRKRQKQCPWSIRKPRKYVASRLEDIVEMDALNVRPLSEVVLKYFTPWNVVSRWDALEARTTGVSRALSTKSKKGGEMS